MCGVVGILTEREDGRRKAERRIYDLCGILRHRGPDDIGVWSDSAAGIYLGHTRLSIIDLSTLGHQPMLGPSGRCCMTYNGEVYNYLELRNELEKGGVRFKSDTDTEVILGLYERYDVEFLQRLRGMFAFGLWDLDANRLMLARDRLGKKPLYYCVLPGSLYFASEIKAVRAALPIEVTVDPNALDEYLAYGFIGEDRTIYREIRELPPGHCLLAGGPGKIGVSRYWTPRWEPKHVFSFDQAAYEAEQLIKEAVTIRLRADTPVGILLSGGIDSGLVTAVASISGGSRLSTFSVGFENLTFDERPLARLVASRYCTDHHEIILKPDVASLIARVAWQYDEPIADGSVIPSFAVAEYARKHVKVVLNGDGGDELFAGYRRHMATRLLIGAHRIIPGSLLRRCARGLSAALNPPASFRTLYSYFHRFLRGVAEKDGKTWSIWFTDGFSSQERRDLYTAPSSSVERTENLLKTIAGGINAYGDLDEIMAIDLLWSLPGDLLVKMDIASMAYSLEARSPFLDHVLVEWALRLQEGVKLSGLTTKPLLRSVAKKYLPRQVVSAPKRGFEVPLAEWLKDDLKEMRDDLILSPSGLLCTLFHREHMEKLLKDSQDKSGRWSQLVWILLMLAAWDRYSYGKSVNRESAGLGV